MISDRASLVASITAALRARGVPSDLTAAHSFLRALDALPTVTQESVYWAARITLIRRPEDVAALDGVVAYRSPTSQREMQSAGDGTHAQSERLPWTSAADIVDSASSRTPAVVGRPGPVRDPGRHPRELGSLSEDDYAQLRRWLARSTVLTRRSRRSSVGRRGRVHIRQTMRRARRTGLEPVHLYRRGLARRPRPVVMILDVSRSMQADVVTMLALMQLIVGQGGEGFVFGSDVTRLTPLLRSTHAAAAMVRVDDLLGGTRIAFSLEALMASRDGDRLRGAVVLIVSDGWDSGEPESLEVVMARVKRRAYRVVWANPRAGQARFEPRVATMAAAARFCDAIVPAGDLASVRGVIQAISDRS